MMAFANSTSTPQSLSLTFLIVTMDSDKVVAKDAWVSHSFCYKSTDFISACWPLTCTCFPFVSHYNTPRNCWSALIDHTAILYYDWMLTLDLEISSIWKRPIKASTIYFVLNRYLSVIGNIFITIFITKRQSLQVNMCQDPHWSYLTPHILISQRYESSTPEHSNFHMNVKIHCSCKVYDLSHQLFIIVNQLFVCGELSTDSETWSSDKVTQVLLILRTWALYQLNTSILCSWYPLRWSYWVWHL